MKKKLAEKPPRANWTQPQTDFFMQLCLPHACILTDRGNLGDSCDRKKKAWEQIRQEFIASEIGIKNIVVEQLQGKYKNVTASLKRKLSAVKQSRSQTGGGPPQVMVFTQGEEAADIILGDDTKCLSNSVDSDANFHLACETIPESDEDVQSVAMHACVEEVKEESDRSTPSWKPAVRKYVHPSKRTRYQKVDLVETQRLREGELMCQKMELEIECLKLKKELIAAQLDKVNRE